MIALQYNPDTLTRTLQVQASGGDGGDRSQALRLQGRGGRDDQARGRDRRDRPARATRTRTPTRSSSASTRSSPRSRRSSSRAPTTCRRTTRSPASGVLEMLPIEAPLTLFVWSKQRVVPVRVTDLSITEEAFDVASTRSAPRCQPRAAGALGRRPRLRPPRRHAVHGATCATRRALAGRAGSVAAVRSSEWRRSDGRPAAGAARRRRRARRRRSRRRAATPTSASTPARSRRRRGAAGAVPPPPARARAPDRFALLYEVPVVEGDRRDLLAAAPPRRRRAVVAARRRERRRSIRAS